MSLTDNTLVKACEYFQLASNYMCKGRKKIIFHICEEAIVRRNP